MWNRWKRAHSVAPMHCFWSAFFAEKVCTVMSGQSGRKSRSIKRKFVTNSCTSEAAGRVRASILVFVLADKPRAMAVVVTEDDCETGRDMVLWLQDETWAWLDVIYRNTGASLGNMASACGREVRVQRSMPSRTLAAYRRVFVGSIHVPRRCPDT